MTMKKIKLIIGLGNPGKEYFHTRHNVGFDVIDQIVIDHDLGNPEKNKNYQLWMWNPDADTKILLVKPLTFMNLSGEVVAELVRFFKIADEDVLIVHDDLDLEKGVIRLRAGGSNGGHNGLKSIEQHLGHSDFRHVKVGIGRPPEGVSAERYVLESFIIGAEGPWTARIICQTANIVVLLALQKVEFSEQTIRVEI